MQLTHHGHQKLVPAPDNTLSATVSASRSGQLNRQLLTASLALLGFTSISAAEDSWQVDAALLRYSEGGGRVQTTEPVLNFKRDCSDDCAVNLKLTYDTLSGSSPNGAIASGSAQTFTTPSGYSLQATYTTTTTTTNGQTTTSASGTTSTGMGGSGTTTTTTTVHANTSLYTVKAGDTPMAEFADKRMAAALSWSFPVASAVKLSLSGDYSHETDFDSISGGGSVAVDLFSRNTTVSLGGNLEQDQIKPIGGAPVPNSVYASFQKNGNQSKKATTALLGVTQVMTRRWLVQLNYVRDHISGYQNDPYKVVSVVDSGGTTTQYRFESRPTQRLRQGVYVDNRFALRSKDVLDIAARVMSDDWGIRSSMADMRYRWQWARHAYVEPHVRYYAQSAADFYRLYLLNTETLPTYVSADTRLADFTATTVGIKLGFPGSNNHEFSVRLETYTQTGRKVAAGVGTLASLDLYPDLTATMAQIDWRF